MCRKRHSTSPHEEFSSPNVSENRLLYDGHSIHSPTNTALLLENIKEEVDNFHTDLYQGTPANPLSASKRESAGIMDGDDEALFRRVESQSLKACKIENDELAESGDTTFALFASLFDSALQGVYDILNIYMNIQIFECVSACVCGSHFFQKSQLSNVPVYWLFCLCIFTLGL